MNIWPKDSENLRFSLVQSESPETIIPVNRRHYFYDIIEYHHMILYCTLRDTQHNFEGVGDPLDCLVYLCKDLGSATHCNTHCNTLQHTRTPKPIRWPIFAKM